MEIVGWVVLGATEWPALALAAGLVVGGAARMRDRTALSTLSPRSRSRAADRVGFVPVPARHR